MKTRAFKRDDGFTLIESMVALMIAAVVLAALGAAALTGVRASVSSRAAQNASNLMTEAIEQVRSMDYASVTMVTADLVGDPRITGSNPYYFDGETVVHRPVGLIAPHQRTITRNKTTYTVSRYVTDASDANGDYKRVTVLVEWDLFGESKTRTSSTTLVDTRRGLPLPRFDFSINGTPSPQSVGSGTEVTWGFWLQNLGARDAWTVDADDASAWTWFLDGDADGLHDSTETTTLPDFNGDGQPDTGQLETNEVIYFVATRVLGTSEATVQDVTFTASSIAQAPPASEPGAVPTRLNVTSGSGTGAACPTAQPSCTLENYWLDQKNDGNQSTSNPHVLEYGPTGLFQAGSLNYSTEYASGVGRALASGTSGALEQDLYEVVDFRFQVPNGQTRSFGGTGSVATAKVWINCTGALAPTLDAYLGRSTNNNMNNFTPIASGTQGYTCTGNWTPVTVSIAPLSAMTLSGNDRLTLRFGVRSTSAVVTRVAYDMDLFPAVLIMPRTS